MCCESCGGSSEDEVDEGVEDMVGDARLSSGNGSEKNESCGGYQGVRDGGIRCPRRRKKVLVLRHTQQKITMTSHQIIENQPANEVESTSAE